MARNLKSGVATPATGLASADAQPTRCGWPTARDDIHEKRQPQEPPRPIEPSRPYISSTARPRDNGPAAGK